MRHVFLKTVICFVSKVNVKSNQLVLPVKCNGVKYCILYCIVAIFRSSASTSELSVGDYQKSKLL